jgi:hypothetical protein
MIGYTLPEIRRLMTGLIQARAPDPEHVWSWSAWRLWVPKTCATWPDAPLTAGCSATRPAHARPVLACQSVG